MDELLGNVQVQAFQRVQLRTMATKTKNKTVGSTNANSQSDGLTSRRCGTACCSCAANLDEKCQQDGVCCCSQQLAGPMSYRTSDVERRLGMKRDTPALGEGTLCIPMDT